MHTGKRGEKLRITARSVSSEILMISSRVACLSAFQSTGRLLYALLFKYRHRKKSQVLLGPVNKEAMVHHRNEKSSAAETKAKRSLADHCCVGRSTILLRPQVMVRWKLWD